MLGDQLNTRRSCCVALLVLMGAGAMARMPDRTPGNAPPAGDLFRIWEGKTHQVNALWPENPPEEAGVRSPGAKAWRMARPDVFSVRNTTVEGYLQPMVHEVKVSRADLLSDLRHADKRESYRWLSCETYYVFPAGTAEPKEIPEGFGVWVLNGSIESGTLVLARPATHAPCKLPFHAWMALAKAAPVRLEAQAAQGLLGEVAEGGEPFALDAAPGLTNPRPVIE